MLCVYGRCNLLTVATGAVQLQSQTAVLIKSFTRIYRHTRATLYTPPSSHTSIERARTESETIMGPLFPIHVKMPINHSVI